MTKIEYWQKFELSELFNDLEKAKNLLKALQIENDNFLEAFAQEIDILKCDNVADFTRLWDWFKSKGEWNENTGEKGNELKDRIYARLDFWKRNQDFMPGTKVKLNQEVGVVLNDSYENNLFGLIRWDTNKTDDTEDWRGMFASFRDCGGEIISQNYSFKFINDDGSEKQACS